MDKIFYNQELVGFKLESVAPGSVPITEENQPLQIVSLKHPKGTYLKAHRHAPKHRETECLQECLVVRKGNVRIDVYSSDGVFIKAIELSAGQIYVSVSGGIGINILEDAEIFEFKNGPFVEDKVLI
ncbi:hypothetical protein COT94_01815 [Candidatus Falkowbacteria bacterium CG10_big_fil_rev_8_21_14_0_10_37_14]|uniref:Sugar 3,4-ketoisomerase QdtA cupin domain-containing protein n=1 Tax=Candidatus Falkowbacteria bacterium CG10_big_fil_rev_8_21_14_0_10_37_14 TaxID=1974561 RepID=A0A2M6WTR3_9BACT|nr:hypothetical protein [Candidatus Falkowbacteria bacterium]PIT96183.1 MAG: hypothetical protein COT94_01815 [Candidatus Falkowbacteria bacterium CG10_big_fil_rev_8_21_14_0_10_37_14]